MWLPRRFHTRTHTHTHTNILQQKQSKGCLLGFTRGSCSVVSHFKIVLLQKHTQWYLPVCSIQRAGYRCSFRASHLLILPAFIATDRRADVLCLSHHAFLQHVPFAGGAHLSSYLPSWRAVSKETSQNRPASPEERCLGMCC